jgi:hypothetical protein
MMTADNTARAACRRAAGGLAVAAALLAGGCVQLETRIRLHEDGSATVTERVAVLRPLLEMEAGVTNLTGATFAQLLGRARAAERAAAMGKGVALASYEVTDGRAGSRVATAVYRAADITQMTYLTPFLMRGQRIGALRIHVEPQYANTWNQRAGVLFVRFVSQDRPWAPGEGSVVSQLVFGASSPLGRQAYRDLAPAFRDMMRGFKFRIVFESYGPIIGVGPASNASSFARPMEVDVVNWSYDAESGGRTGAHPLDGEEAMADLVKLTWAPPRENEHWTQGEHVRVGRYLGPSVGQTWFNAVIRPSRPYFDKYFAGKDLVLGEDRKDAPAPRKPARFEEIGERGQDRNVVKNADDGNAATGE